MNTQTYLTESNVAFGTSGARGLVTDFTPEVCAAFAHAFIAVAKQNFSFDTIALGIDNRPSSITMAKAIAVAVESTGLNVVYYGVLPTPALAYQAMTDKQPCIMVTGSHIPFDRNGLKFYRPDGEITKADEEAINKANVDFELNIDAVNNAELKINNNAVESYINRYTSLFDIPILQGKSIGVYEHSSAGRDVYYKIFEALGASVTALERSDEFVPIDTEAVSEDDRQKAKAWSEHYGFDAIFSTDGDGDRPLIADENGEWLRGDILGLITAITANIDALAVPVSCNTAIEKSNLFNHVARTKIGSPYVIAEFDGLNKIHRSVAGFEANGGFLLGSDIEISGQKITALPTRDAIFPAIMLFMAAIEKPISHCISKLPKRFTASDRITNFATEKSKAILTEYSTHPQKLVSLLGFTQKVKNIDLTDGLRMILDDGNIIHLRPSGNAPELRCYAEANMEQYSNEFVLKVLNKISAL